MSALLDCGSCAGFLPPGADCCPHCGVVAAPQAGARATSKGLLGTIATAAAGGLMSLTLMACYGVGYVPCEDTVDADQDGYYTSEQQNCDIDSGRDCDDANPDIHPGAEDPLGDDIDQNCDGQDGGTGGGGGTGGTVGSGGNGPSGGGGSGGSGGSGGFAGN